MMRISSIRRSSPERGFALAAVLWLLAGLTILAAMISQSSQISAERQMRLKQRADAEQSFLSTRSEALFWLSTSLATEDGFGWRDQLLRVDSRGYAVSADEKSTIHFQDMRGLLDLNRPNRPRMARLLVRCGAHEDQTESLMDALEDYIDKDKLKRLNGAEAMEYSSKNLSPPRNAPLLAEPEIWKVYGWAALRPTWDEKHCFEDVTIQGEGRFNIGTATAGALYAYGLNEEQVTQLVRERAEGVNGLVNVIQAREQSTSFFGVAESKYPARTLRVTHAVAGMPWVLRYEVKLTSNVEGSPWEISAPRRIPASAVTIPAGRSAWPQIEQMSDTEKNVITKPALPF